MSAPLLRVRLLLPGLETAAQTAAQAVYGMRAVDTPPPALQEAREHALRAADGLITAAGTALTP